MRLDLATHQILQSSRNEARRMIEAGLVRVNGRVCLDKGFLTLPADKIEAETQDAQRVVPQMELPLEVLAQGDGWIVVNKPPGMPVHPLRPGETGTVLNAVVARFPEIQGVGEEGGLRCGVVHRLDVETSGCLAFALTSEAWRTLRHAFAHHTTRKIYIAEVSGLLTKDGVAELDLVVRRHSPAFVAVARHGEKDARRCRLSFKVLETRGAFSRVEVELETGFLHQIRATFAHLGHPLVGDALYGGPPAPRLMLHAETLECWAVGLRVKCLQSKDGRITPKC